MKEHYTKITVVLAVIYGVVKAPHRWSSNTLSLQYTVVVIAQIWGCQSPPQTEKHHNIITVYGRGDGCDLGVPEPPTDGAAPNYHDSIQ